MKITKEGYKKFEKVWNKKIGLNSSIIIGKETFKSNDIDLKKLTNDIVLWSEKSCKGICCGIYGCIEPVISRCIECKGGYCDTHEKLHMHRGEEQGFLQGS